MTGEPHIALGGLRLFSRLLVGVSLLLVGGAWLLLGIDFSLGVLLGCGIVVLNYLWSKRVFSRVLQQDHPKVGLGVAWSLKFTLTALILYLAILQFQVHPVGIVVGVSAIVIAGVLFGAVKLVQ